MRLTLPGRFRGLAPHSPLGRMLEILMTRGPVELLKKALGLFRREGAWGLGRIILEVFRGVPYSRWIQEFDTLSAEDRRQIGEHVSRMRARPLISILMPVYNTPEEWLRRAIGSVHEQLYPHWELCIADDASTQPHVRAVLEEAQMMDSRIKVTYRGENGHISATSNTALSLVAGEFVALLDHDDELPAHALYMVAAALDGRPDLDLIYSDEDKIDLKGRRYAPYFKPDWNPDLCLGQNLVSHLGVYRTSLVRSLGGFREGFEGSQDWDLALRVIENTESDRVHHIPHVLYHWRSVAGSTARHLDEKDYAVGAAERVLRDHFQRKAIRADIDPVSGGNFHIRYPLPRSLPLVSVVVPTRNGLKYLERCLNGLLVDTDYPALEVIVVDNQSDDPASLDYLERIRASGLIKLLRYDKPFNYSAINNWAVRHAKGELICLLNNDIEVIGRGWLKEMVSHALRKDIGAVGAMLYYPNDTIQHAGVYLDGYVADHFYVGQSRGIDGDMNRARLAQNLSAVTGACMVVRKSIWDEVGGLDEKRLAVAFNDIDFCLKIKERGYRNLWTPFAELYHHESASRGSDRTGEKRARFEREIAIMRERWGESLLCDSAVSPNRSLSDPTRRLANPPRVQKPWRVMEA